MLLKELQEGSNTQALWSDKNGVGSGYAKAGVKRGLGFTHCKPQIAPSAVRHENDHIV